MGYDHVCASGQLYQVKAAKGLVATAKEWVEAVAAAGVAAKGWVATATEVVVHWEPLSQVPDSPVPSNSELSINLSLIYLDL